MSRTIQEKVISAIGSRRSLKYFSEDDLEQNVSNTVITEIVEEACVEAASYSPIYVTEEVLPSDDGMNLVIAPIGPGCRRLWMRTLLAKEYGNSVFYPLTTRGVTYDDGVACLRPGWYIEDSKLFVYSEGVSSFVGVEQYKAEFAVIPTIEEVEDNATLTRTVVLLSTAIAIERIMGIAGREITVELPGVPKITDNTAKMLQQVEYYRSSAHQLLGDYMAVA